MTFEEIVQKAKKFFNDFTKDLPLHPTLDQVRNAFNPMYPPEEDLAEYGDIGLLEDETPHAIWCGEFWNPDKEHERFVGIWVNTNSHNPAENWKWWIGWKFKKAYPDEVGHFVNKED